MIPFVGHERTIVLRNGSFRYRHAYTEVPENRQHKLYGGNGYQLLYLVSGDITYQIEDAMLRMEPGDLLLINNRESHRPYFSSDVPFERIVVFFNSEFCSHFDRPGFSVTEPFDRRPLGTLNLVPKAVVVESQLYDRFMEIEEQIRNHTRSAPMVIELAFLRGLVDLGRTLDLHVVPGEDEAGMHRKVEEVMVYIHRNLDKPVSLDFIEKNFFISRFHFSHLFTRYTGTSFKDFLVQKKMAKAAELLNLSVPPREVMERIGYSDYSSFYRAFVRIHGTSPSKFRFK